MKVRIVTNNFVTPVMLNPQIVKINEKHFTIQYKEFIPIDNGKGSPMSFAISKDVKEIVLPIIYFKKLNRFLNEALSHIAEVQL